MNDYLVYVFFVLVLVALLLGIYLGGKLEAYRLRSTFEREFQAKAQELRKDAVERSKRTLKGKGVEHLVPYLPQFPYEPSDARFIGSPVDLIVFKGNTRKLPEELVFIEVKSGAGSLSKNERMWRDVIQEGKVRWEMMRV